MNKIGEKREPKLECGGKKKRRNILGKKVKGP